MADRIMKTLTLQDGNKYIITDEQARNDISTINTTLDGKQNKLVAGENITIDPVTNTISATITGGSSDVDSEKVNQIYTDLYDEIAQARAMTTKAAEYAKVYTACDLEALASNVANSVYSDSHSTNMAISWYQTSTFSGIGSYLGKYNHFNVVKLIVGKRDDSIAPTQVCITICKIPENLSVKGGEYTPKPNNFPKIAQQIFDIPGDVTDPAVYSFKFDEIIENPNNEHLFIHMVFNARAKIPYVNQMNSYNPWTAEKTGVYVNTFSAYATIPDGQSDTNIALNNNSLCTTIGYNADLTASSWRIALVEIGLESEESKPSVENGFINTEDGGKFFKLVKKSNENGAIATKDFTEVEIRLAKRYELVVGDTFQLFFSGIVKCQNVHNYIVFCYGDNALSTSRNWPRYWEFTPSSANVGEHTLHVEIRDNNGKIMTSGETTINVNPIPSFDTSKTVNCLFFGASLLNGGHIAGEAVRRIIGGSGSYTPEPTPVNNLTLKTFGAFKNTINGCEVNTEAYGGWTRASFLSSTGTSSTVNGIMVTLSSAHGYEKDTVQKSIWVDNNNKNWELEDLPSTTTIKFNRGSGNNAAQSATQLPKTLHCESLSLDITVSSAKRESGNPFYNDETSKVDFNYHADKYGATNGYDIAYCITTYNGINIANPGTENRNADIKTYAESNINNNVKKLLNILHEQMPNCKFIMPGISLPSSQGGIPSNYTSNMFFGNPRKMKCYVFEYNKYLEEMCNSDEYKDWVYFCDYKAQFDAEYGYPKGTRPVNVRSSSISPTSFQNEEIDTNGIHPSNAGKYQMADATYRTMIAILNKIAS